MVTTQRPACIGMAFDEISSSSTQLEGWLGELLIHMYTAHVHVRSEYSCLWLSAVAAASQDSK